MSSIRVDYDILNQKQTPAFYASSLATRPAFGFPGRIFIDTDTPSSGIYRDTGSAWVQVADPGAGTTGTLQQVTTNGNTTTLGVTIQGLTIGKGAGTIASNTAIGNLALNSNTTGSGITAIGSSALQSNTTGQNNIGVGANSLFANTTGGNNTGLGANTLIANTTASFNTAIGSLAMSLNSTGSNNTAVGYNSLLNNTIGVDNTAIGTNALLSNSNGGSNTAIGIGALFTNSTGNSNTAIGKNALNNNTTASNNTAIGINSLSANTTGTSNVAIGSSALTSNTTGGNNTAIGLNSLTLNTTGTQNTAVGTSSLYANTTANYNTAIGVSALTSNTTGDSNTAVGQSALQTNTTGANNVAIGYGALISNTTASNNTAIGNTSLEQNTTGVNNTAIGSSSLKANTTGQNNSSLGTSSLIKNTTGTQNIAIGSSSLQENTTGQFNTAIGYIALRDNTTANNNTAVGNQALYQNTTGTGNTAIGQNAGSSITTGNNNTLIGSYGGTSTLTSNIVLSDGAGNVRLFSDANGLIGINQAVGSTIGGQLDIHSTQTYALVLNGLSTSNAYTAFSNASVGKWRIGNTYNAGANTFDIYNLGTNSTALSFNSTTNSAKFINNVIIKGTSDNGFALQITGNGQYIDGAGGTDGMKIIFNNTTASEYQYSIVNGGASLNNTGRLSLRNGSIGINLLQLDNLGTAYLQEIKAGVSSLLNTTTSVNGTGGGNREFDGSFTGTSTGFTGTDSGDQGYGYFPVTIVSGKTYQIKTTFATTNGFPLTIFTSNGTNFVTNTIQTINSTITDGTSYYQFTATASASYIGIGFARTSGTMTAVVSNFSIVKLHDIIVSSNETITINGSLNIANTIASSIATPSTHKISMLINGVQYYLLATNI